MLLSAEEKLNVYTPFSGGFQDKGGGEKPHLGW